MSLGTASGLTAVGHVIKLHANIRCVDDLEASLRQRLYAVYAAYYDASEAARFEADLAAKQWVILLWRDDVLVGFSTVACARQVTPWGPVRVVFSGDTVIERDAWGDQALSRAFATLCGALWAQDAGTPLYWLLISKGHRTYRYLTLFARRYVPHPLNDDAALRALADHLATARWNSHYDPARGVVSFPQSMGHLREAVADVAPHLVKKPDVALFLQRNPGWARGDELVCLTALHPDNLRSLVRNAFLQGSQTGLSAMGLPVRSCAPA